MVLALGAAVAAYAQSSVTLTFDENGYSSAGFQSRLFLDSNGGGNPPAGGITTLDYLYPVNDGANDHVQLGWLVITDPNDGVSDLIRFDSTTQVNGATYQQIFFYSIDHDGDLADNWPSSAVVSQILTASTTVFIPENANGDAFYTPIGSSSPGFHLIGNSAGTPFSYVFISDVPEPTTIAIMVTSLLLLALNKRGIR